MRLSRSHHRAGALVGALALAVPLATVTTAAHAAGSDLTYDRAETYVQIASGATATHTATCPSGSTAVNGSFHIDGDSVGEAADLVVRSSNQGSSARLWTVTLSNSSDDRVTGRVRATCLGNTTEGGQVLALTKHTGAADPFDGGYADTRASCPGSTAIGAGWSLSGDAYLIASSTDGSSWAHSFESAGAAATATSTVYCIGATATGGGKTVEVEAVEGVEATSTSIRDASSADATVSCPEGSFGVAGTFAELGAGVFYLGAESTYKNLRQRFYNDSGDEATVTTGVVCLTSRAPEVPEKTIREDDNTLVKIGNGARTKLSGWVVSDVTGSVTGKVFVKKSDGTKGARLATGKVTVTGAAPTEILMRVTGRFSNQGEALLVLSGRGVSNTYAVTINN